MSGDCLILFLKMEVTVIKDCICLCPIIMPELLKCVYNDLDLNYGKKKKKYKEHCLLKIFSFQDLSVDMTDHALNTLHSSPVCQLPEKSHDKSF